MLRSNLHYPSQKTSWHHVENLCQTDLQNNYTLMHIQLQLQVQAKGKIESFKVQAHTQQKPKSVMIGVNTSEQFICSPSQIHSGIISPQDW
jgi:hypothetical protein